MTTQKRSKAIPSFESEAAEREYWATHDTADHVDWSLARTAVFPKLKPSTETISPPTAGEPAPDGRRSLDIIAIAEAYSVDLIGVENLRSVGRDQH